MSANKQSQRSSQTSSRNNSKREPKPMEQKKTIPDVAETKPENSNSLRPTHWIINQADGTKQCESCGAVMRGWAYREPFDYCPKCGKRAEKAE